MNKNPQTPHLHVPDFFVPLCLRVSLLLLCLTSVLPAAELPSTPILRIDPGMHTAAITKIATNASGSLVLTCSEDKTAKLWSLSLGQPATLLRTLRIPIGEGSEGKLYACALSPDGTLAAIGGFTGADGGNDFPIYIFDSSSGQIATRISGLRNITFDLAFSAGGRWLAASLGGTDGLRLFDVSNGQERARDKEYGDDSYSVDWHADQRLVTTSYDGTVRLYRWDGSTLVNERKTSLSQGKQPFTARFSPDGQRIVVGFNDSTKVAVLISMDLSLLFSPSTRAAQNGDLSSVAWNNDGSRLAAGGRWNVEGAYQVRQWAKGGEGRANDSFDSPTAENDLMSLRAQPKQTGGGFLYAARDPAWGQVSEGGQVVTHGPRPSLDFRNRSETLCLSTNGLTFGFGYVMRHKGLRRDWYADDVFRDGVASPVQFSLDNLELQVLPYGSDLQTGLVSAKTTGITIEHWKNNGNPSLNGQVLKLHQNERCRSLAVAKDNSFFLLGCDSTLRCLDAQGHERWQLAAQGEAWAVNLTANDQLAVAAFGDGTVRWYLAGTGQTLLAFFAHADRKRWVLWSPEGYFTCSPGAEDLIGWHVNQGPGKAADFFPCRQLYDAFYRPDIVKKVIAEQRGAGEIAKELGLSLNIESALRQTPEIKLTGVSDGELVGAETLQLTLEATDTGGGLKDISLFHNGKRVPPDGPPSNSARGNFLVKNLRFTLTLSPGDNQIRAQAANDKQTIGTPAELTVKFNGVQATSTLHLFTIGLNRYQNPRYNLTYCVPDADACAAAFTQRAPGLFAEVKTYALRDAEATKLKIAETFATIASAAKPSDVFIFCYAGHGVMGELPDGKPGDNEFYLIPHDITRMYGDPEMLAEKGVSKADLETWCANIPARKQVMLLDTCQSGGLVDTFAMRGVAEEKAIAMLARSTGTMVIASTGAEAYARESKDIGHGIFTKALLDGMLEAKADSDKDGKITVKEMDTYIGQAVPELSQKLTNTPQFPTSYARGQDFPIGIVK